MDIEELGFYVFMDQQEKDQAEQKYNNYRSSELNTPVGADEPH